MSSFIFNFNYECFYKKYKLVYKKIEPKIIYMPFSQDTHTDHPVISKVLNNTIKWFRFSHIKRVLMYETLSETNFNFMSSTKFEPNVFNNISNYLDEKVEIMHTYHTELGNFPFPRSVKTIKALAALRGSHSGYDATEAFELVYEKMQ